MIPLNRGVSPKLFFMFGSASARRRHRTHGTWLLATAKWSGVSPILVRLLRSFGSAVSKDWKKSKIRRLSDSSNCLNTSVITWSESKCISCLLVPANLPKSMILNDHNTFAEEKSLTIVLLEQRAKLNQKPQQSFRSQFTKKRQIFSPTYFLLVSSNIPFSRRAQPHADMSSLPGLADSGSQEAPLPEFSEVSAHHWSRWQRFQQSCCYETKQWMEFCEFIRIIRLSFERDIWKFCLWNRFHCEIIWEVCMWTFIHFGLTLFWKNDKIHYFSLHFI